jgi:hypothetical protein
MALKPGLFNKVLIVVRIVDMIAIRHKIAQMLGMLIAFTLLVILGMFWFHNTPRWYKIHHTVFRVKTHDTL